MGLVEEEHQLGKFHITHLGHLRVQLGDEPQQESGVELWLEHKLVCHEHVHYALAILGVEKVLDVEGRLAEELLSALVLKGEDGALDGSDAGGGDVSVLGGETGCVLAYEIQHHTQVLEVQEQQIRLVSDPEEYVQHSFLGVVEFQYP